MPVIQLLTPKPRTPEVEVHNVQTPTPLEDEDKITSLLQEMWIDFCARAGLEVRADGTFKTQTIKEFAAEIGVARQTLYNWKKSIPNFSQIVRNRAIEIRADPFRVNKVWNGLMLKGASGDSKAAALYLFNNDENFKLPGQKLDDDNKGGLADLMQLARVRRRQQENGQFAPDSSNTNIIEGELVNAGSNAGQ